MHDEETHSGRKGNVIDRLGATIEKDGVLLPAENRRHLIEQSTAYPDELILRLAAQPGEIEWRDLELEKPGQ